MYYNRIVEWTDEGIRYEADQRHAEIIIRELGLRKGKSTSLSSPGLRMEVHKNEEDKRYLRPDEATKYRHRKRHLFITGS